MMAPLRHPKNSTRAYRPDEEPRLCWFDEMLGYYDGKGEAGLYIPHVADDNRPFLLIVSGPPGSAKSTFALQISYNFARCQRNRDVPEKPAALYITTETTSQHIIDKAKGFGWDRKFFAKLDRQDDPLMLIKPNYTGDPASTCYVHAVPGGPLAATAGRIPILDALERYEGCAPDILVIDSFNTIPGFDDLNANGEDHPIARLMQFCHCQTGMRPRLFILVLDVESGENQLTKRFGFFADATVKFGMSLDDGGLLHRTVEITKIKSQKHSEGVHVIQIFKEPPSVEKCETSPFLREGGLFVYPSIQWYLAHVREFKGSSRIIVDRVQAFRRRKGCGSGSFGSCGSRERRL